MLTWEQTFSVTDCARQTSERHSSQASATSSSYTEAVSGSSSSTLTAATTSQTGSSSTTSESSNSSSASNSHNVNTTRSEGVHTTLISANSHKQSGLSSADRDQVSDGNSFTISDSSGGSTTGATNRGTNTITRSFRFGYSDTSSGATTTSFGNYFTFTDSGSTTAYTTAQASFDLSNTTYTSSSGSHVSSSSEREVTRNSLGMTSITRSTQWSSRSLSDTFSTTTASGMTTNSGSTTDTGLTNSIALWETKTTTQTFEALTTIATTLSTEYTADTFSTEETYTDVTYTDTTLTETIMQLSSASVSISGRTSTDRRANEESSEWMWKYSSIAAVPATVFYAITDGTSTTRHTYRELSATSDSTLLVSSLTTYSFTNNNKASYTLTFNTVTTLATTITLISYEGIANSTATTTANLSILSTTTLSFTSGISTTSTATATMAATQTSYIPTTTVLITFLASAHPELLNTINSTGTSTISTTFAVTTTVAASLTPFTTSSSGSISTSASGAGAGFSTTSFSSSGNTVVNSNTTHYLSVLNVFGTEATTTLEIFCPIHLTAVRETPDIGYTDAAFRQIGPGAINAVPYASWSSVQHNVLAPIPGEVITETAGVSWTVTLDSFGGLTYTTRNGGGSGTNSFNIAGSGARDITGYQVDDKEGGFNEVPGQTRTIIDYRIGFWRETKRDSNGGSTSQAKSATATALSAGTESIASFTESELGGRITVSESTLDLSGVPGVSTGERVYIPGYLGSTD